MAKSLLVLVLVLVLVLISLLVPVPVLVWIFLPVLVLIFLPVLVQMLVFLPKQVLIQLAKTLKWTEMLQMALVETLGHAGIVALLALFEAPEVKRRSTVLQMGFLGEAV